MEEHKSDLMMLMTRRIFTSFHKTFINVLKLQLQNILIAHWFVIERMVVLAQCILVLQMCGDILASTFKTQPQNPSCSNTGDTSECYTEHTWSLDWFPFRLVKTGDVSQSIYFLTNKCVFVTNCDMRSHEIVIYFSCVKNENPAFTDFCIIVLKQGIWANGANSIIAIISDIRCCCTSMVAFFYL